MSAARLLERLWWRRAEPALAEVWLWPLSLLALGFRAGSALHRGFARPQHAAAPVISVGNLAAGGSGKTPVALYLCQRLRARGRTVALLSRGYGAPARAELTWVCRGDGPQVGAERGGDEAVLAARRAPWLLVLSGPSRALLARAAVDAGADALVLDDGLQHHGLARSLDVVVADARNPLGNGRLLPRGPLREHPDGLRRLGPRGLLWLSGAGGAEPTETGALRALAAEAGLRGPVESALAPTGGGDLRGARVLLLAGIARPERFADTARALGAEVRGEVFFPDHHRFSAAELEVVQARAAREGARILTTEKDRARLPAGFPAAALAVSVQVVRGAEALEAALDAALASPPPSSGAAAAGGGGR